MRFAMSKIKDTQKGIILILRLNVPQHPEYPLLPCNCIKIVFIQQFVNGILHNGNRAPITIWVLNKIVEMCDSSGSILPFGFLTKNCFMCINDVSLNLRRHDLYKWSIFSIRYQMTRYVSTERTQILRDTSNKSLETQNSHRFTM